MPHVAFEATTFAVALTGHRVIIEPNSPSRGVTVAFIEVSGTPVELMQIDHRAGSGQGRRAGDRVGGRARADADHHGNVDRVR
jgi:hypothetical protein